MKRILTLLMILLFLVSTTGISTQAHYCHGELMSMTINGIGFTTSKGHAMSSYRRGSTCPHCKDVMQHNQVTSKFAQGQSLSLVPLQTADDWFHGALPVFLVSVFDFIPVEEDSNGHACGYVDHHWTCPVLLHSALRAPPARNIERVS